MGINRTAITATKATAQAIPGTQAHCKPAGAHGNPICAAKRCAVEHDAPGNGLRFGDELLAQVACLAAPRCMATHTRSATEQAARGRQTGLLTCHRGQLLGTRCAWGKKTGPNPTDRRKAGSKHHIITEANGVPLNVIVTGANHHDVTQLLPLVDGISPIRGKPGRARRRPRCVQGDRAYDSQPHRKALASRGIRSLLARRNTEHGSGLGKTRWVVERTLAWLHHFRRLKIRYERLPNIHEAFLSIGCTLICWNFLKNA